jgi:hypothetical protein
MCAVRGLAQSPRSTFQEGGVEGFDPVPVFFGLLDQCRKFLSVSLREP